MVNTIRYGGSWTTSAIYGNRISDNNIFKLVTTAITTNKFPLNTNGVYFVLTSAEVTASSGFCSDYCGECRRHSCRQRQNHAFNMCTHNMYTHTVCYDERG